MAISKYEVLQEVGPWYKQGWPWFIISFPAISVVLGFNLLYLAHQTNNSLVVDDYYKEGKAININAERDRVAASHNLSARLDSTDEGIVLQIDQPPETANRVTMPETLSVRWVHVTQAEKDGGTNMIHIGGGRYLSAGTVLPASGQWRLHIEPVSETGPKESLIGVAGWRLVSDRVSMNSAVNFTPQLK